MGIKTNNIKNGTDGDYLVIYHDGNFKFVSNIDSVDMSYVKSIIEIEIISNHYDLTLLEVFKGNDKTIEIVIDE